MGAESVNFAFKITPKWGKGLASKFVFLDENFLR